MVACLSVNTTLTDLRLEANKFSSQGFAYIREAVRENPYIQQLLLDVRRRTRSLIRRARVPLGYWYSRAREAATVHVCMRACVVQDKLVGDWRLPSVASRRLAAACARGDRTLALQLLEHVSRNELMILAELPESAALRVPHATIRQGVAAVRKWITDAQQEAKRIKLLVLGHARAGKTTLLQTMRQLLTTHAIAGSGDLLYEGLVPNSGARRTPDRAPLLFSHSGDQAQSIDGSAPTFATTSTATGPIDGPQIRRKIPHPESTVGIELHGSDDWPARLDDKGEIRFKVFDFAGQIDYTSTHQHFLSSSNAIYLVAVDVTQSYDERERQLKYWIDFIADSVLASSRSAGSSSKRAISMILVGTQTDRFTKESNFQECRLQLRQLATQHCKYLAVPASQDFEAATDTAAAITPDHDDDDDDDAAAAAAAAAYNGKAAWRHRNQIVRTTSSGFARFVNLPESTDDAASTAGVLVTTKDALISSATHAGVRELMHAIVRTSRELLSNQQASMVPLEYAFAEQQLCKQDRESVAIRKQHPLCRMSDLIAAANAAPDSRPSNALVIDKFDESMAEWLHNVGAIVVSPSRSLVCIEPQLLAKLMSTFVCTSAHHLSMQSAREGRSGQHEDSTNEADDTTERAVVSEIECLCRIRETLDSLDYTSIGTSRLLCSALLCSALLCSALLCSADDVLADASVAMQALLDWQVCFVLESDPPSCRRTPRCLRASLIDTDARSLIFPSMMPVCDTLCFPPLAPHQAEPQFKAVKVGPISLLQFNRLQVVMHANVHPHYRMYANGMLLAHVVDGHDGADLAQPALSSVVGNCSNPTLGAGRIICSDTIGMAVFRPAESLVVLIARGSSCQELLESIVDTKILPHCGQWLSELLAVRWFDHKHAKHMTLHVRDR